MDADATAAIVVYQGVLVDETEVFRFVLSRVPDFRTVTVGTTRGTFPGPGGVESAEATLEEVGRPEVVAVPGGIGCHQRSEIANWLQTLSPAWILASSTGSALLAAAGLLRDSTAATHWLAGPLLERHGAHPSREQVVVDGPIITCSGAASAFRAALVIAEAYGGSELADRIRAEVSAGEAQEPRQTFWRRLRNAARRPRSEPHPRTPTLPAIKDTDVLDLGLVILRPHDDRIDDS